MNDLGIGFMSSGYSSQTGCPLPSARRIDAILSAVGRPTGPSYFCLGGRVSGEQQRSEGMKEDSVHMKGPAEMVKDDLAVLLPDYMVPNRVVVLDRLPLTANGKVDTGALAASALGEVDDRPRVPPRSVTESQIGEIWSAVTNHEDVSVHDDFFAYGGDSLMAVTMVSRLSRAFERTLPLQILFEAPTIAELARVLDSAQVKDCSRLIQLDTDASGRPMYCWPGLGGYPMNLRPLAAHASLGRPLYGIQAHGINDGETPYRTTTEMAAADVSAIRSHQPDGPYTLCGYSFGARVAFETAYQLEQAGEEVDCLLLIAPGSPKVAVQDKGAHLSDPGFRREVYLTVLFSVFAGNITDPALKDFLAAATDDEAVAAFIAERVAHLDRDLIRRITDIVRETYEFRYSFTELTQRRIAAPVTIFKAQGDDYSFLESSAGYSVTTPTVISLTADHYAVLKDPGVAELARLIRYQMPALNRHTVSVAARS
jgi:thioesterase domain-containing protein